jgi:hypothetical protein
VLSAKKKIGQQIFFIYFTRGGGSMILVPPRHDFGPDPPLMLLLSKCTFYLARSFNQLLKLAEPKKLLEKFEYSLNTYQTNAKQERCIYPSNFTGNMLRDV